MPSFSHTLFTTFASWDSSSQEQRQRERKMSAKTVENWRQAPRVLAFLPRDLHLRHTGCKSRGPHRVLCTLRQVMLLWSWRSRLSVWISFPSAFLPFRFPPWLSIASANVAFGHPSPHFFSILIAALSLLLFDFGHPQREEENSRRKGSRGWAPFSKAIWRDFLWQMWVSVQAPEGGQTRSRHPMNWTSRGWRWLLATRGDWAGILSSWVYDLTKQVINSIGLKLPRLFLKWPVLAVINTLRSPLWR